MSICSTRLSLLLAAGYVASLKPTRLLRGFVFPKHSFPSWEEPPSYLSFGALEKLQPLAQQQRVHPSLRSSVRSRNRQKQHAHQQLPQLSLQSLS